MRPCAGCSRRALLVGLAATAACGGPPPADRPPDDSAPAPPCGDLPADRQGWVELPLADHPALREPGGQAEVQVPEALLDVVVVHRPGGCFAAVWRICSHGACAVAWEGEDLHCPCHGSRFDLEGQVLVGPATAPLRAFTVLREGDSLWLDRGL